MMINILDALHEPDIQEIAAYCANDLFDEFCHDLYQRYQVKPSLAYSKCTMQKGWNVKFKKAAIIYVLYILRKAILKCWSY